MQLIIKKLDHSSGRKIVSMSKGFTIVELLVVIVVIGILAAITIISYSGISQRAVAASLQSDLASAKKQLQIYQTENDAYPTEIDDCPTPAVGNLCISQSSGGNDFSDYSANNTTNPPTFTLDAFNGDTIYRVTNDSVPVDLADLSLAVSDPDNWLAVGTQVWAKYNLNVGTMVTGVTEQTNNSTLEKYCQGNNESNCTTYGGLYQWNETMQYVTTEGTQGICPTGSHVPSDNDVKILEVQLGMTQLQADATDWRGTDEGTQLMPGGTSDLDVPLGGNRDTFGAFYSMASGAGVWTSSESGGSAWLRGMNTSYTSVNRNTGIKANGFSVRCIEN